VDSGLGTQLFFGGLLTVANVKVLAFVVALKVTLWLLPCEAAGLALGTQLAVRRTPKYTRKCSGCSCS